mmetsp:Transcript_108451/g.183707  ORF Transcript_108451/g.183707 Transcript_108451/m.183707 type:complete len:201 (+) Transcript_108451:483-1085(+)
MAKPKTSHPSTTTDTPSSDRMCPAVAPTAQLRVGSLRAGPPPRLLPRLPGLGVPERVRARAAPLLAAGPGLAEHAAQVRALAPEHPGAGAPKRVAALATEDVPEDVAHVGHAAGAAPARGTAGGEREVHGVAAPVPARLEELGEEAVPGALLGLEERLEHVARVEVCVEAAAGAAAAHALLPERVVLLALLVVAEGLVCL